MIVHDVDIIEHELNEFHAVPGHLIKTMMGITLWYVVTKRFC